MHSDRKYRQISHALLLKTIYDVKGANDDEIMPTSPTDVDAEAPADLRHPCDFSETAKPVATAAGAARHRVLRQLRPAAVGGRGPE